MTLDSMARSANCYEKPSKILGWKGREVVQRLRRVHGNRDFHCRYLLGFVPRFFGCIAVVLETVQVIP